MDLHSIAAKVRRNVEDYGWGIAWKKILARAFSPIYEKRVYRIYRIDIQTRDATPPESDRFDFRILQEADHDAMRQIGEMAEWLADDLEKKISGQGLCLAAFDGDRVAGFNLISIGETYIPLLNMRRVFRQHDAWSEQISVHLDYRKMGLASQLRGGILAELKQRGYRRLYGGTLTSNLASLRLAKSVGFTTFVDVHYRKVFGFESRRYKRIRR